MVFNKPIVSFNLKESMYSLGNTGIFIESNDFDGMAKNIINLTSDDNLKNKLGKETSLRLAELNWEVVSVPLVESYNKLHLNC